ADAQRVEREHLAELLAREMTLDEAEHAPIALEPHQIGDDPHHRPRGEDGDVPEPEESLLEDLAALLEEALVAGDVVRTDARDLRPHPRRVAAVVEGLPVVEADPVEGIDGNDLDEVLGAPPGELEELLDQERRGDDRRARVEDE